MIEKTLPALRAAEKVLIITHINPDGDAIGASLGLKLGLESMAKQIQVVCRDNIPTPFLFLSQSQSFKKDFLLGDFDLVVIIDCGDLRRTGFASRLKDFTKIKKRIVNIDHHRRNDLHKIASINCIDYNASSASEIVFNILKNLNIKINADIATCLLTGIHADTGGFRHSNTTSQVLDICSELLKCGARLKKINEQVAHFKSIPMLRLWGLALSRVSINSKLGIAVTVITEKDFEVSGAMAEDIAGCVNLINAIEGARAALIIYEMPDGTIRGSLRTEDRYIDASEIAAILGGGGIKKAGGFSVSGQLYLTSDGWKILD